MVPLTPSRYGVWIESEVRAGTFSFSSLNPLKPCYLKCGYNYIIIRSPGDLFRFEQHRPRHSVQDSFNIGLSQEVGILYGWL